MLEQEINSDSNTDELPYGMDKDYLAKILPSGLIRTWLSVDKDSLDSSVNHELSLKVSKVAFHDKAWKNRIK